MSKVSARLSRSNITSGGKVNKDGIVWTYDAEGNLCINIPNCVTGESLKISQEDSEPVVTGVKLVGSDTVYEPDANGCITIPADTFSTGEISEDGNTLTVVMQGVNIPVGICLNTAKGAVIVNAAGDVISTLEIVDGIIQIPDLTQCWGYNDDGDIVTNIPNCVTGEMLVICGNPVKTINGVAPDENGNVNPADLFSNTVDNGDGTYTTTNPDGTPITWSGDTFASQMDNGDGTVTFTMYDMSSVTLCLNPAKGADLVDENGNLIEELEIVNGQIQIPQKTCVESINGQAPDADGDVAFNQSTTTQTSGGLFHEIVTSDNTPTKVCVNQYKGLRDNGDGTKTEIFIDQDGVESEGEILTSSSTATVTGGVEITTADNETTFVCELQSKGVELNVLTNMYELLDQNGDPMGVEWFSAAPENRVKNQIVTVDGEVTDGNGVSVAATGLGGAAIESGGLVAVECDPDGNVVNVAVFPVDTTVGVEYEDGTQPAFNSTTNNFVLPDSELKCKDVPDSAFADICEPTISELQAYIDAQPATSDHCMWHHVATGAVWAGTPLCCVKEPQVTCEGAWFRQTRSYMPTSGAPGTGDWDRIDPDTDGNVRYIYLPTGDVFHMRAEVILNGGTQVSAPNPGFLLNVLTPSTYITGSENDIMGYRFTHETTGTRKESQCAKELIIVEGTVGDVKPGDFSVTVTNKGVSGAYEGFSNWNYDFNGLATPWTPIWTGGVQGPVTEEVNAGAGAQFFDSVAGNFFAMQIAWGDNGDAVHNGEFHQWTVATTRFLPYDVLRGADGQVLKILDCEGEVQAATVEASLIYADTFPIQIA